MRPTDQHQDGSTRPNLLSSGQRRSADDDNILARLERDTARQVLGKRKRAAWHAAAAALVLLLIIVVAWIAYENVSAQRMRPMLRAPVDLGPANATESTTRAAQSSAAAAPPAMPQRATPNSVPETPRADAGLVRDNTASSLPPLVLLEGARSASAMADGAAVAAAPAGRAHPVASAQAAPVSVRKPVGATALTRTAPRPAAAARPRKLAVDDISTDALADTDVALLAAIILHDSTHAAEKARLEAKPHCARANERHCDRKPSALP